MAGELIRLLVNHPDVAIIWVDSARYAGRLVSDVHHGLLGETNLSISPLSANSLDGIDVLFIFRHKGQTIEWLDQHDVPDDLRIVDLSIDMRDADNADKYGFVYGMPELNRKPLVRGAKRAVLPHPAAIIAELALLPLAKHGALISPIQINVSVPLDSEQIESGASVAGEISDALRVLQPEFDEVITIASATAADSRAISATVDLDTTLDIGQILHLYEEYYDDHNFTFIVENQPEPNEVDGTNKCLICIDKHNGRLTVSAIMDALLKGAAGTAVHDMNLLFGLHERVGLALKASTY